MNFLKTGFLCILLIQIWALDAMAQTTPYPDFTDCIKEPTKIVYANGILGNKDISKDTARIIHEEVSDKMSSDLIITYANGASNFGWGYCHDLYQDIQFNPSATDNVNLLSGALFDLYQSWIQLVGGDPVNFTRGIFGFLPWPIEFESTAIEIGSKNVTPGTNSELFNYANTYQSEKHPVGPTGQEYPWRYVIVSHSQGNFFTNDIYAKYFGGHGELSAVRLLSAANPDNEVADGGKYVTLTNDKVIIFIKDFITVYNLTNDPDLPLPMTPLTSNNLGYFINHSFLPAYFRENSNSHDLLVQNIIDQIDIVPFTRPDPDDPTVEIPLEPAGINPTTGEQEACPANDFTFASSGYECTTIYWFGVFHCQPTGPSCNLN